MSSLDRIQKKLGVPEKEWEKFKFAIVSIGRAAYISEDDFIVNIADFRPNPSSSEYTINIKMKKMFCTVTFR